MRNRNVTAKQLKWPLFFLTATNEFLSKGKPEIRQFCCRQHTKNTHILTESVADLKVMTFNVEQDTQWLFGALDFSCSPLTIIKIDICWSNWNPIEIESIPDVADSCPVRANKERCKEKKIKSLPKQYYCLPTDMLSVVYSSALADMYIWLIKMAFDHGAQWGTATSRRIISKDVCHNDEYGICSIFSLSLSLSFPLSSYQNKRFRAESSNQEHTTKRTHSSLIWTQKKIRREKGLNVSAESSYCYKTES